MAVYTHRVQSVLTQEQYEALVELSQSTEKPLSVLIREAVEKTYLDQQERDRRQAALERLLSLKAPVSDWPDMEQEISQGATSS
jgi:predicted DNA-binding protein